MGVLIKEGTFPEGGAMQESRKDFLDQLERRKLEYEETLRQLVANQKDFYDRFSDDNSNDETDHAQREISACSNYSLIERKTRELKNIERLIRKVMKDGSFGLCEECGEQIPMERLLIVPETTLCVVCQSDLEKFSHMRDLAAHRSGLGKKREWDDIGWVDEVEDDLSLYEMDLSAGVDGDAAELEESTSDM